MSATERSGETAALRTFARGGSLALAGFVVGAALQMLLTVMTTRGLSRGSAGALFETVAFVTILAKWGELGVASGFERSVPPMLAGKMRADLAVVLMAGVIPVAIVGLAIAVVCGALASDLAAVLFSSGQHAAGVTFVRVLTPTIPLISLTAVLLAGVRSWGTMRGYVVVANLGLPIARPVLLGLALALGGAAIAVALAWSIPAIGGCVVATWLLAQKTRGSKHAHDPKTAVSATTRRFWTFTAPRGLSSGFLVTVSWLDVILVGAIASTRQAAIYTATSSVAVVGTYALQAVGLAIAPQFSKLAARGQHGALQQLYRVSTWWMMAVTCPVYILLTGAAPIVLRVFGHGYAAGESALVILAAAGLVNVGTGNVTILLLMSGKSGWSLVNAAVALALNIALNLLLIPPLGLTGAAIAWACSIAVNNIAAALEVWAFLRLSPFGAGYWVIAGLASLCFGGVSAVLRLDAHLPIGLIALTVCGATTLYIALLGLARNHWGLRLFADALGVSRIGRVRV